MNCGEVEMDPFVFVIALFLAFLVLLFILTLKSKGKQSMYLIAITATLSAWFIGLVLDANIHFGPDGFLAFRVLLPILTMGLCILNAIVKTKSE